MVKSRLPVASKLGLFWLFVFFCNPSVHALELETPSRIDQSQEKSSVVIFVHGVKMNVRDNETSAFSYFQTTLFNGEPESQPFFLDFEWSTEPMMYATGMVGERYDQVWGASRYQWAAIAKLKNLVAEVRAAIGSEGKISLVSYSQGTVVSLGALQEGMRVDNWILMGSPLGSAVVDGKFNTHFFKASKNVTTTVINFCSDGDWVVGLARPILSPISGSGIGNTGLPASAVTGKKTHVESASDTYVYREWVSESDKPYVYNIPVRGISHSGSSTASWLSEDWLNRLQENEREKLKVCLAGSNLDHEKSQKLKQLAGVPIYRGGPQSTIEDIPDGHWAGFGATAYGREFKRTFRLTKDMTTGFHFDDCSEVEFEISCLSGEVEYELKIAPWFAWRTENVRSKQERILKGGKTSGRIRHQLKGGFDATVFLEVKGNVEDSIVECWIRPIGCELSKRFNETSLEYLRRIPELDREQFCIRHFAGDPTIASTVAYYAQGLAFTQYNDRNISERNKKVKFEDAFNAALDHLFPHPDGSSPKEPYDPENYNELLENQRKEIETILNNLDDESKPAQTPESLQVHRGLVALLQVKNLLKTRMEIKWGETVMRSWDDVYSIPLSAYHELIEDQRNILIIKNWLDNESEFLELLYTQDTGGRVRKMVEAVRPIMSFLEKLDDSAGSDETIQKNEKDTWEPQSEEFEDNSYLKNRAKKETWLVSKVTNKTEFARELSTALGSSITGNERPRDILASVANEIEKLVDKCLVRAAPMLATGHYVSKIRRIDLPKYEKAEPRPHLSLQVTSTADVPGERIRPRLSIGLDLRVPMPSGTTVVLEIPNAESTTTTTPVTFDSPTSEKDKRNSAPQFMSLATGLELFDFVIPPEVWERLAPLYLLEHKYLLLSQLKDHRLAFSDDSQNPDLHRNMQGFDPMATREYQIQEAEINSQCDAVFSTIQTLVFAGNPNRTPVSWRDSTAPVRLLQRLGVPDFLLQNVKSIQFDTLGFSWLEIMIEVSVPFSDERFDIPFRFDFTKGGWDSDTLLDSLRVEFVKKCVEKFNHSIGSRSFFIEVGKARVELTRIRFAPEVDNHQNNSEEDTGFGVVVDARAKIGFDNISLGDWDLSCAIQSGASSGIKIGRNGRHALSLRKAVLTKGSLNITKLLGEQFKTEADSLGNSKNTNSSQVSSLFRSLELINQSVEFVNDELFFVADLISTQFPIASSPVRISLRKPEEGLAATAKTVAKLIIDKLAADQINRSIGELQSDVLGKVTNFLKGRSTVDLGLFKLKIESPETDKSGFIRFNLKILIGDGGNLWTELSGVELRLKRYFFEGLDTDNLTLKLFLEKVATSQNAKLSFENAKVKHSPDWQKNTFSQSNPMFSVTLGMPELHLIEQKKGLFGIGTIVSIKLAFLPKQLPRFKMVYGFDDKKYFFVEEGNKWNVLIGDDLSRIATSYILSESGFFDALKDKEIDIPGVGKWKFDAQEPIRHLQLPISNRAEFSLNLHGKLKVESWELPAVIEIGESFSVKFDQGAFQQVAEKYLSKLAGLPITISRVDTSNSGKVVFDISADLAKLGELKAEGLEITTRKIRLGAIEYTAPAAIPLSPVLYLSKPTIRLPLDGSKQISAAGDLSFPTELAAKTAKVACRLDVALIDEGARKGLLVKAKGTTIFFNHFEVFENRGEFFIGENEVFISLTAETVGAMKHLMDQHGHLEINTKIGRLFIYGRFGVFGIKVAEGYLELAKNPNSDERELKIFGKIDLLALKAEIEVLIAQSMSASHAKASLSAFDIGKFRVARLKAEIVPTYTLMNVNVLGMDLDIVGPPINGITKRWLKSQLEHLLTDFWKDFLEPKRVLKALQNIASGKARVELGGRLGGSAGAKPSGNSSTNSSGSTPGGDDNSGQNTGSGGGATDSSGPSGGASSSNTSPAPTNYPGNISTFPAPPFYVAPRNKPVYLEKDLRINGAVKDIADSNFQYAAFNINANSEVYQVRWEFSNRDNQHLKWEFIDAVNKSQWEKILTHPEAYFDGVRFWFNFVENEDKVKVNRTEVKFGLLVDPPSFTADTDPDLVELASPHLLTNIYNYIYDDKAKVIDVTKRLLKTDHGANYGTHQNLLWNDRAILLNEMSIPQRPQDGWYGKLEAVARLPEENNVKDAIYLKSSTLLSKKTEIRTNLFIERRSDSAVLFQLSHDFQQSTKDETDEANERYDRLKKFLSNQNLLNRFSQFLSKRKPPSNFNQNRRLSIFSIPIKQEHGILFVEFDLQNPNSYDVISFEDEKIRSIKCHGENIAAGFFQHNNTTSPIYAADSAIVEFMTSHLKKNQQDEIEMWFESNADIRSIIVTKSLSKPDDWTIGLFSQNVSPNDGKTTIKNISNQKSGESIVRTFEEWIANDLIKKEFGITKLDSRNQRREFIRAVLASRANETYWRKYFGASPLGILLQSDDEGVN